MKKKIGGQNGTCYWFRSELTERERELDKGGADGEGGAEEEEEEKKNKRSE